MIGRPSTTEYGPFYAGYVSQVPGEDALAVLKSQVEESATLFAAISEEKSLYRYAPEKWSIRQLLNHVTDTERAFAFRTLWFARGFSTPLPGFDQDIAAAGAQADRITWADHVEEFRQIRLSTISLFTTLPADAWMRTGIASDNPFTVRSLCFITAGHAAHHFKVLRERYL